MKKLLLPLAVAIFAIASPLSAQIIVGPKVGLNFNSFRKSEAFKNYYDVIPGFNAGIFGKYRVTDFLNARAEILYNQQGANLYDYRVMSDLYRRNSKVRFHAVTVPILAEFGLPSLQEEILQPRFLLGGFFSYTFYARESYENIAQLTGRDAVEYKGYSDVNSQFKPVQFGIMGGIGADVKMFSRPVSIEFRYQYNINRANEGGTQYSYNLQKTHEVWGDKLYLHTLSINVSASLFQL